MESIEIASDLVNSIALRSEKSQDAYKGNQGYAQGAAHAAEEGEQRGEASTGETNSFLLFAFSSLAP